MSQSEQVNPIIKLPQGRLEGFVMKSRKGNEYFGFYGLPFAKTVERFELPRKWEAWNGLRNGTRALDRCIQISRFTKRFLGSEQCLFLNVFTPKFQLPEEDDVKGLPPIEPPDKFPVMVFLHGGGYNVGGGDLYGGSYLVDEKVIFVTLNYRLGALGFLNTGEKNAPGNVPGNLGLHDQIMALKWIQENIKYFAGDQDNVTLMGESAGAACVHFHMLSSLSSGLFSKAIMQSGTAICPWAFNHAPIEKFKKLLKQLDLNGSFHHNVLEAVSKLKRLDAEALVAQRKDFHVYKEDAPMIHFAPSIDSCCDENSRFLIDSPMKLLYTGKLLNEVPLILGINGQEGLYKSIPILRDPAKVKSLNEHWCQELPTMLMYKKDGFHQHDDFARKIRKFYFNLKPIANPEGEDARKRLTNMISDRLFNYPTRKTALIHRSLVRDPGNKIYLYRFEYTGAYSYCNGFEVSDTFGASHADELQYLTNQRIFYSKINEGSEADLIVDKMVSYWTNFAKTGVPSFRRSTSWEPMPLKHEVQDDVLQYFKIDVEDMMINEQSDFTERMEFWDHVPNLSLVF